MNFVLKAETEEGAVYYFANMICITPQIEHAKKFASYEEAENHKGNFKMLVFLDYLPLEEPTISIVKIEE